MKIIFWSGKLNNCGPDNVTKQYLKNLDDSFVEIKSTHKYNRFFEAVWKLSSSDIIVASGVSKSGALLFGLARLLRKKAVYIMHGCARHEMQLNKTPCSKKALLHEAYLIKYSSLVLPVSKQFMNWVKANYPEYAYKTKYLFNGINQELLPKWRQSQDRREGVIAAGGDRRQKMNEELSMAVESLDGLTNLTIYGGLDRPHDEYLRYTKYAGKIPYDQLMQRLSQAKLLVLNSVFEPFSLVAIEALMCGCSVLLSEKAGVTDLLELEECDLIHDPENIKEIQQKIRYLLEHPNNQRIMEKLDVDDHSYPKQVQRLKNICLELLEQ